MPHTALDESVNHWKTHSFRDTDIPYNDAIYSLDTSEPMIELKRCGQYEWVVSCGIFNWDAV